jgi:hypothetical protein
MGKVLTLDRGLEDMLPYLSAPLGVAEATAERKSTRAGTRRRTFEASRLPLRESLNQPVLYWWKICTGWTARRRPG